MGSTMREIYGLPGGIDVDRTLQKRQKSKPLEGAPLLVILSAAKDLIARSFKVRS